MNAMDLTTHDKLFHYYILPPAKTVPIATNGGILLSFIANNFKIVITTDTKSAIIPRMLIALTASFQSVNQMKKCSFRSQCVLKVI